MCYPYIESVTALSDISGMQNSVADCISRFHMQVFQELAQQANLLPTPIPSSLQNLLTAGVDTGLF